MNQNYFIITGSFETARRNECVKQYYYRNSEMYVHTAKHAKAALPFTIHLTLFFSQLFEFYAVLKL